MGNWNDISIKVVRFDDSGTILFRVDAGACEDSAGQFDYVVQVRSIDGQVKSVERGASWSRTHNASVFEVREDFPMSSGDEMRSVSVEPFSFRADCYSGPDAPPSSKSSSELNRAGVHFLGQVFDLENEIRKRIIDCRTKFGPGGIEANEIGSITDIKILTAAAEYGNDIIKGWRKGTEVVRETVVNKTPIDVNEPRTISTVTKVGGSASVSQKVGFNDKINLGINIGYFSGGVSSEKTMDISQSNTGDWSEQTTISKTQNIHVPPNKKLVLTMTIFKEVDAAEFEAELIFDANVSFTSQVFKSGKTSNYMNQGDRTFSFKGMLYDIVITDTTVTYEESEA